AVIISFEWENLLEISTRFRSEQLDNRSLALFKCHQYLFSQPHIILGNDLHRSLFAAQATDCDWGKNFLSQIVQNFFRRQMRGARNRSGEKSDRNLETVNHRV